MTFNELAYRAFRLITTAGGTGETPTDDEMVDALAWCNSMIDAWGLHELTKYMRLRTATTLVSGTASYSIGSGGTINIVRPTEIKNAGLILDTSATYPVEEPIAVLTEDEYAAWPEKTFQSTYARAVYYNHNWSAGLGLLYPLPIPNVGTTQLVIYTPVAIAEFADRTTDYTFPPGYEEALEYNLAVRLATPFGRDIPEFVATMARSSLAVVKRANLRASEVIVDTWRTTQQGNLTASRFTGGTF